MATDRLHIGRSLERVYTFTKHVMGYRFALFNDADQQPGGFVDFDHFDIGKID